MVYRIVATFSMVLLFSFAKAQNDSHSLVRNYRQIYPYNYKGNSGFDYIEDYGEISYDYSKFFDYQFGANEETCGIQEPSSSGKYERIMGGTAVRVGEFPWLAWIKYNVKGYNVNQGFACQGTLISRNLVITVSTCLASHGKKVTEVVLGGMPLCHKMGEGCNNYLQTIKVKDIFTQDPNKNPFHSLSLIQLAQDVTFSKYVMPICLITQPLPPPFYYWVTDWYQVKSAMSSPIKKMKIRLPMASKAVCKSIYPKTFNLLNDDEAFCAGGKRGRNVCTRGAPLMTEIEGRWYLVGISTYGNEWCKLYPRQPFVFLNVTAHVNWIGSVMDQSRNPEYSLLDSTMLEQVVPERWKNYFELWRW